MASMTIDQILAAEAQAMAEAEKTLTYQGYCVADLRQLFDRLCDTGDWKGPIAVTMHGEAVNASVAAMQFFTATTPRVTLNTDTMQYLVASEGYRMGPAGDH